MNQYISGQLPAQNKDAFKPDSPKKIPHKFIFIPPQKFFPSCDGSVGIAQGGKTNKLWMVKRREGKDAKALERDDFVAFPSSPS